MGLDLPLDHFRLLGVSPATDAQTVLRTLQLRLDRAPDQGYTDETLRARADLLRASADLLSDSERRAHYESDLTALADAPEALMPALEIPSSREVAGLLLLLEAGQPVDVFHLASRCLQPPQAPALGSSREADLCLLAGEACLAAADEYRRERHYEVAARTLQQGLQLLQRMGQLPDVKARLHEELEAITPFRVLDLLSRDPAAGREREEGLALLEQLVHRRGGLEGNDDDSFAAEDFQTFFKQIRSFLTVQEQIDLFDRWSARGSGAAEFLACIALTASGFAQRKPDRIATARDRLQASGRAGIEPLLANLDLLLGDVDGSIQRFETGAGAELQNWAARQSDEPLGRLCAWCRDWLSRDVLPGYRDLDADPDLEAYFTDRDVTAWVEREDRRRGRLFVAAETPLAPLSFPESPTASTFNPSLLGSPDSDPADSFGLAPLWPGLRSPSEAGRSAIATTEQRARRWKRSPEPPAEREGEVPLSWKLFSVPDLLKRFPWSGRALVPAVAGLGVALMLGSWLLNRHRPGQATSPQAPVQVSRGLSTAPQSGATDRTAAAATPGTSTTSSKPPSVVSVASKPPVGAPQARSTPAQPVTVASQAPTALTMPDPQEADLSRLLETWLQAKTDVLAGRKLPEGLDRIARDAPLQRLEADRQRDRNLGQTQTIDVHIERVAIRERSPRRIALEAELRYSDSTLRRGQQVNRTPETTLRNVYVFGRDGDSWRLAASGPAR